MPDFDPLSFPALHTGSSAINRAYRIALGDLVGNVRPFCDGLLSTPAPVILAGLDYDTPWTRDAAINVWNGIGLIWPATARNTLLSVLERSGDGVRIGGQYWDAILWTSGAWAYYLTSGDRAFLALALEAVTHSLRRFEAEEFDPATGLFRGPAVFQDGVAAYPDRYSPGGTSAILDWPAANPGRTANAGYGIPMKALSTNCAYAEAYRLAAGMAAELGVEPDPAWEERRRALVASIQARFWDPERQSFRYLVDGAGGCDYQEGLGHAFALLFGVATRGQAAAVLQNQHLTPHGIPCVWPSFTRYTRRDGQSFGRHSGTVWPFISGFWGEAALAHGRADRFESEFAAFTALINRHAQCPEIVHPLSGDIYGGLQESAGSPGPRLWDSCARQSWSASAYLRLVLSGLCGMRFSPEGLAFAPTLPSGVERLHLAGLPYRHARLDLTIEGQGASVVEFCLNGAAAPPFLPCAAAGEQHITIRLG